MQKGDIIKLDYDLYIKESGELYETTDEELAKENDIHREGGTYAPLVMVVEKDKVIKGLEDSLLEAEAGKEYEVEIPPDGAYGDRDPKLVELRSMREITRLPEFRDDEKYPEVGMRITYKNKEATIARVTAGRVRLDFNHPLAGKTLRYKYKVTEGISDPDKKIDAIVEMDYGSFDGFEKTMDGKDLSLKLPEQCKYDQRWVIMKYKVIPDLRDHTDFESISFVEEYTKKAAADAADKAEEEAPEEESGKSGSEGEAAAEGDKTPEEGGPEE